MRRFWYFNVHVKGRANVREPLDPQDIVVPIMEDVQQVGEMALSVPQALELIGMLVKAVQEKCRRADIRAALNSRATGSMTSS